MKNLILIAALVLATTNVFSQSTDTIKEENKLLKEKIKSLKAKNTDTTMLLIAYLKEQNQLLQERIKILENNTSDTALQIKPYSTDIIVRFIKCIGNPRDQTVTLTFTVINPSLPDQKFSLYGRINEDVYNAIPTQALDETGNAYIAMRAKVGTVSSTELSDVAFSVAGGYRSVLSEKLSTGNFPLLCSVTFVKVLPSVKFFTKVDMGMSNKDMIETDPYHRIVPIGITEFNNVKITWR